MNALRVMSIALVLPAPVQMRPWPFMAGALVGAASGREATRRSDHREAPPMVITGITTFEVASA